MKNLKQLITALFLLTAPMIFKAQNITTIAGDVNQGYSGDGGLANSNFCELNTPEGVYVDKAGNVYIGDESNEVIRMINTNGIITTFAGNHALGIGYSGDGKPATEAQLNNPVGVCGDAAGNIYIAEYGNNVIRMVNPSGIISTYAGTGIRGFSGEGTPATQAQLFEPVFIHTDIYGNLYIADWSNQRIRKVNTSGIISTIAGNGEYGYNGDGGIATSAELNNPSAAWADSSGNIYIVDDNNERIRRVNTSGIISTIAGNGYSQGVGGYSGDGGQATDAELSQPADLYIDAKGNILITDADNNRIRKIDASGIISTIVGNGKQGYTGNGGTAIDAELYAPGGICSYSNGNISFTDQGNEVVRKIVYSSSDISNLGNSTNFSIYPNPTTEKLFIICDRSPPQVLNITISDVTGRDIIIKDLNNIFQVKSTIDVSVLLSGVYFITISSNEDTKTMKFIKQ